MLQAPARSECPLLVPCVDWVHPPRRHPCARLVNHHHHRAVTSPPTHQSVQSTTPPPPLRSSLPLPHSSLVIVIPATPAASSLPPDCVSRQRHPDPRQELATEQSEENPARTRTRTRKIRNASTKPVVDPAGETSGTIHIHLDSKQPGEHESQLKVGVVLA
ncbi:uncharacterized protein [Triticum aestivum]|uniref:uncharacterized protein isoform X1 n=1 Tax=Triticum aestivum TaxID=4565 RepID=UPI001D002F7D|nr:uncharacterized protein LOC123055139 isoform X1 [Triticum aestivum]